MTAFTVTITDPTALAAISTGRALYNVVNAQAQVPDDATFFNMMVAQRLVNVANVVQDALLQQAIIQAQAGNAATLAAVSQIIAAAAPKA